jgi:hypothetical protein
MQLPATSPARPLTSILVSAALGALASADTPEFCIDRASSRALSKHCLASLCNPATATRVSQKNSPWQAPSTKELKPHQQALTCSRQLAETLLRTRLCARIMQCGSKLQVALHALPCSLYVTARTGRRS